MKKTLIVVAVLAITAFAVTSCRSTPAAQRVAIEPDFVQAAQFNPPADAYVGIGNGRALTSTVARQMAENRARVSIAQQMNSSVRNMITDYSGTSEIEPAMLQFFETVSVTLAEAQLVGSRPVTQTFPNADGSFEAWTVMTLSKDSAHNTIASAAEAARTLAPHASAALWSMDRMEAAFENRDRASVVRD